MVKPIYKKRELMKLLRENSEQNPITMIYYGDLELFLSKLEEAELENTLVETEDGAMTWNDIDVVHNDLLPEWCVITKHEDSKHSVYDLVNKR